MWIQPSPALACVWIRWGADALRRGPAEREGNEPRRSPARAQGSVPGPSSASEHRARLARCAPEPPMGPSPAPSGALSRPRRRSAPLCPSRGSRAPLTVPTVRKAASLAVPTGQRPVARRTSARRDPGGSGPKTLALLEKPPPPPPEAHAGRGRAPKASDSETHTCFQHPALTQKFSTKCAMTIVPPPRRVPCPHPPAAV